MAERGYETLGVNDWIASSASGIGETVLLADSEHRFRNWRSLRFEITPDLAWKVISHMEAFGASTPGDAAVVVGAAKAGFPAGSAQAQTVYDTASTIRSQEGLGWESIEDPYQRALAIRNERARQRQQAFERGEAMSPSTVSYRPGEGPVLTGPEEPESGFFGDVYAGLKGTSRWFFSAMDVVPEGIDAIQRAAFHVKTGNLGFGEALGGMIGVDREAAQLVGIPFFQYLGAGIRGERINMGTGFFAEGEIAPDIQSQLASYDAITEGPYDPVTEERDVEVARSRYQREVERTGGNVLIEGPDGQSHRADSFEEWQFLRRSAGRANLLAQLQYASPTQEAMGQPFGSFQEAIFDEGTVGNLSFDPLFGGEGKPVSIGAGAILGRTLFEPDRTNLLSGDGPAGINVSPYNLVSAPIDFGKQLLDLNLIGYTAKGVSALNRGRKFIGQAGEAGDLIRGSDTIRDIFRGVDEGAASGFFGDLGRQTINRDLATNALARNFDDSLNNARRFIDATKRHAAPVLEARKVRQIDDLVSQGVARDVAENMVGKTLTEGQIDNLVSRAGKGDEAARRWAIDILKESPMDTASGEFVKAIDDLASVTAREGVDLFGGRLGKAVVDDEIMAAARGRVDELGDLLEGRRAGFIHNGKQARAVMDPDAGVILSYDADLVRAQKTLSNLYGKLDETLDHAEEQRQVAQHMLDIKRRFANSPYLRDVRLSKLGEQARKLGLDPDNWTDLEKAAYRPARTYESAHQTLVRNLFDERWATGKRYAERLLGDTDEAADEVANLIRVLRRNEAASDIVNFASEFPKKLPEGKLNDLLRGSEGVVRDFVESIKEATTTREVMALLHSTREFGGRIIPPPLIDELIDATTDEAVIDAFLKSGNAVDLIPQRIGLLGRFAQAGAATTSLGIAGGGVMGAYEQAQLPDAGWGDIVGGALSGAVFGGLVGSGVAGLGAWAGGGLTRNIDNVADGMDMLLAGTRATTLDFIASRGRDVNRAMRGLSAPVALGDAFGHTAWGRRIARSYRPRVNLSDPYDMFYTLYDVARSFGVEADEVVTKLSKGTGDARSITRVIASEFDTADDFAAAVDDLVREGWRIDQTFDLDEAFRGISRLQPNNPAAARLALKEFFGTIEQRLVSRGMDDEQARFLTRFISETDDDFLGNVNSVGKAANYEQAMVLNGSLENMRGGALLSSEMWTGNIQLPPPDLTHRAVAQLDFGGRIMQTFTSKGSQGGRTVLQDISRKLRGKYPDVDWSDVLTPSLEYNVWARTARTISQGIWSPSILLTRPMAFLSRVFLDDQMRMLTMGMDNPFWHPWRYFAAAFSDNRWFPAKPRGIVARSLIPDNYVDEVTGELIPVFDEAGNLIDDGFSQANEWAVSERVKDGLGIMDREAGAAGKLFGQDYWRMIDKNQRAYKRVAAGEFRQLIRDPMVRHMARSSAADPIQDTLVWLTETSEGQEVLANWAMQFDNADQARFFGATAPPDELKAFLKDQYHRLHAKTGGAYIYVADTPSGKAVIDSNGITRTDIDATGYEPGYHLLRRGEPEMLRVIGGGKVGDEVLTGPLNEDKVNAIQDFVSSKIDEMDETYERMRGVAQDPSQLHQMPDALKGSVYDTVDPRDFKGARGVAGLTQEFDKGVEYIFDWWLGRSTDKFSRQPVLGQYYWERIGLLYNQMDEVTQNKFLSLARQIEGRDKEVLAIADAIRDIDVPKGILDDFDMLDLQAKAYAVERTKDTLFDLTRQRNFIDGMRVVAPFTGPMVEAFEAWGRIIRERPLWAWRRSGQLYNHLWSADPLASPHERSRLGGYFWVDEDSGERMISFPFTGTIKNWMHENLELDLPDALPWLPDEIKKGDIPAGPVSARLRGFNIVFGPEDLTEEDQPSFMGFPVSAMNPGTSPVVSIPAMYLLDDVEGWQKKLYDEIFPFGEPPNVLASFLPYNVRKFFEGHIGEASREDAALAAADQLNVMFAEGLIGPGDEYEYNVLKPGAMERAFEDAKRRGRWAAVVEGVTRGVVPTMITPETYAHIEEMKANGLDTDLMLNLSALQEKVRELYSPEGAEMVELPDGSLVSTEGDYEIIDQWLIQQYTPDLYDSRQLTESPTTTVYPNLYTETASRWANQNPQLFSAESDLRHTAHLLMPDYALIEQSEEYDFDARTKGAERGDWKVEDWDVYETEIEGRLLSKRLRAIEVEANRLYGPDDLIEGDLQDQKDVWVSDMKAQARGVYENAATPESVSNNALTELLAWNQRDWDSMDLTPEERATVDAVLWYLSAEDFVMSYAAGTGLTKITNKGSNSSQRQAARNARADLRDLIETQLRYSLSGQGADLGNFPYIWTRYLQPRLEVEGDEDDPLLDLAASQGGWGPNLDMRDER